MFLGKGPSSLIRLRLSDSIPIQNLLAKIVFMH